MTDIGSTVKEAIKSEIDALKISETIRAAAKAAIGPGIEAGLKKLTISVTIPGTDETLLTEREAAPYKAALHFLAALITFSLAVIVAILSHFPTGAIAAQRYVGGILSWITITAVVATICAAALQFCKGQQFKPYRPGVILAMGLPIVPGVVAVSFSVLAGAAAMQTLPASGTTPQTLWNVWDACLAALKAAFQSVF